MDKNKFTQAAAKLVQKGQLDKAIAEYQKARKADPKDVRILLKIGELQQKKGDNQTAAATLMDVAKSYAAEGFFLKAVAVYKQIVKLDPDRVHVNLELAELYQQLGLLTDAMAQLQVVANHHEKSGDVAAALDVLRRMVDLDPDNVTSRIKLGELFAQQGQTKEALRELRVSAEHLKSHSRTDDFLRVGERIVSLAPDDLALSRELASLYLLRRDPRRALARLQANFGADPKDVATLDLLARAFLDLEQTPKAASVYKALAKVHRDAGRHGDERTAWRKVLELAPGDEDATAAVSGPGAPPPAQRSVPPPPAAPSRTAPPLAASRSAVPMPGAAVSRPASVGPSRAPAARVSAGPAGSEKEKLPKLLTEIDVYLKYGLNEKAAAHVAAVLALDPSSIEGLERAIQVHTVLGNGAAAREAMISLARACLEQGDPERGQVHLHRLIDSSAEHPEVAALIAAYSGGGEDEADDDRPPPPEASILLDIEDDEDAAPKGRFERADAPAASSANAARFERPETPPPAASSTNAERFERPEPPAAMAARFERPAEAPAAVDAQANAAAAKSAAPKARFERPSESPNEALANQATVVRGIQETAVLEIPEGDEDLFAAADEDDELLVDDDVVEADDSAVLPDADEPPTPGPAGDAADGADDELLLLAEGDAEDEETLEDWGADPVVLTEAEITAGPSAGIAQVDEAVTAVPFVGVTAGPVGDEAAIAAFRDDEVVEDPWADSALAFDGAEDPPPGLGYGEVSEIEHELAEGVFFLEQGYISEAQETFRAVLAKAPDHPLANDLLAEAVRRETEGTQAPEIDAPPPTVLQRLTPGPKVKVTPTMFSAGPGSEFDLAAELASEIHSLGPAAEKSGEFQYSVEDVLAEFKRGVSQTVSVEDTGTHYDLGIAYKEMGLLADAVAEFTIARQGCPGTKKEIDCLTMAGMCEALQGKHDRAIAAFQEALGSPEAGAEATKALHFEIGLSFEATGDMAAANDHFRQVARADPAYRDVALAVSRTGTATPPPAGRAKEGRGTP